MSETLEAVKLILERMKTNPEEFDRNGKFNWVANSLLSCREQKKPLYPLTKEETELIMRGLQEIDRNRFNVKVFNCLMRQERREPEQLELPYATIFTNTPIRDQMIEITQTKENGITDEHNHSRF